MDIVGDSDGVVEVVGVMEDVPEMVGVIEVDGAGVGDKSRPSQGKHHLCRAYWQSTKQL
jgi:hypothetical protein